MVCVSCSTGSGELPLSIFDMAGSHQAILPEKALHAFLGAEPLLPVAQHGLDQPPEASVNSKTADFENSGKFRGILSICLCPSTISLNRNSFL